jgi:hypothetical protein
MHGWEEDEEEMNYSSLDRGDYTTHTHGHTSDGVLDGHSEELREESLQPQQLQALLQQDLAQKTFTKH